MGVSGRCQEKLRPIAMIARYDTDSKSERRF